MTLSELKGQFLTYVVDGDRIFLPRVDTLADAHGVQFLCPKCFAANGGSVGTHLCICWFAGKVPDNAYPKPGRWMPSGSGMEDLTFVPYEGHDKTSVLLTSGCEWHGHIVNGETRDC